MLETCLICLLCLACSRQILIPAGKIGQLSEGLSFRSLGPLMVCMLGLGWDWGLHMPYRFFSPLDKLPVIVFVVVSVPLAIITFAYFLKSRLPLKSCLLVLGCMVAANVLPDISHFGWCLADWTDDNSTLVENILLIGVGEETIKLLPLFLILLVGRGRRLYERMSYTDFLWIGYFSGMGFGIGETLNSYLPSDGQVFAFNQYVRWFSVIPLTAVWTVICAAILWRFAAHMEKPRRPVIAIGLCLLATVPSAILHGCYDYVFADSWMESLLIRPGIILVSLLVLYFVVKYVGRAKDHDPVSPPEPAEGVLTAVLGQFQRRVVLQFLAISGASVIIDCCVSCCSFSQEEFNRLSVTPGWEVAPFPVSTASESDYQSGRVNIPRLLKAAENGDAKAWCRLGDCYYCGNGVPKDLVEAAKCQRKAADQGLALAQCCLGLYYYWGEGVAKDRVEAVTWLRKSAEQGFSAAQTALGRCYYFGDGITKDLSEAAKWYRRAAMQGDADAWNDLRSVEAELAAAK